MSLLFFFFLVLLALTKRCFGFENDDDLSTLRNVVVVLHGGLHSLDSKQIYKYLKNPFAEPVGELTTRGKQQGTEIGFALRQRYGAFVNNYTYNPYEVRPQSSKYRWINGGEQNRTFATSLLVAAGFFPPSLEYEIWNEDLLWQPIPVHENPQLGTMGAFLLTLRKDCESLDWVTDTESFKKLRSKYDDYIRTICTLAGTPSTNIRYAFVASTALGILSHYPEFLPEWANETLVKSAHKFYFDVYDFLFSFKQVLRLASGYLLELVLKEWRNHLDYHMQRKMLGFSVVFYWYNATLGPNRMKILNCADPCSLATFEERSEEFIPDDWAVECGEVDYIDQADTFTGLYIIFTVLFTLLAVVFCAWWCWERKELKRLQELYPEYDEHLNLSQKPNYDSLDKVF